MYEEGKNLADSYGISFFETSAKDGKNIKESFHTISKEIKEKILIAEQTPQLSMNNNQSIRIQTNQARKPNNKKAGCC